MFSKPLSVVAQLAHVNSVSRTTTKSLNLLHKSKTAPVIRQSMILRSTLQPGRITNNHEALSMARPWPNQLRKALPMWKGISLPKAQPGTTYFSMHHKQLEVTKAEKKPISVLQALLFGIEDPDAYSFKREILGTITKASRIGGQTLEVKKSVVEVVKEGEGNDIAVKVVQTEASVARAKEAVATQEVNRQDKNAGDFRFDGGHVMFLGM